LNKNQWEGFDEEKELFYDNDTFIYDMETDTYLTTKEFYSTDYSVDEDSRYARNNNLKSWYGYIYTDGDRIASIGLMKDLDSLLKQRVTNGIIEVIEDDRNVGWTTTLRNANDWSNRHEEWVPKNSSLRVNLEGAIVIKDGKLILPEELKIGDRLYLVRDDFRGKVVIVK